MRGICYILPMILVMVLSSCDVLIHEYPNKHIIAGNDSKSVDCTLNLVFDTDMPIYQQITHPSRTASSDNYDIRYIVEAYRIANTHSAYNQEITRLVSSKGGGLWDHSINIELAEGVYDLYVWADYVLSGTTSHKYYNTDDLSYISIVGDIQGCDDYRDAFIGRLESVSISTDEAKDITIPMERPLAKYRFISNDIDTFLSQESNSNNTATLNDYYIVFTYPDYVNTSYNILLDTPAAPSRSLSYRAHIKQLSEAEAEIGFDYIFVGNADTKVSVSLEIFRSDNTKVGGVDAFFVPLSRGKLTEVRGAFLTTKENGGIGVDPEFDDEITIPIS